MNAVKSSNPKRKSARIDVSYDAMLISSDGHEFRVVVKDLSSEGFRIEIDGEVRAGEQIFLRTKRDGDIPAQIVWVIGTEAGGTFLAKSRVTSNDPLAATSYASRCKRLTGVSYVSPPKSFQQNGSVPSQLESASIPETSQCEQSSRGDVGTTSRAVDEPATRRPIHPSWVARAGHHSKTGLNADLSATA